MPNSTIIADADRHDLRAAGRRRQRRARRRRPHGDDHDDCPDAHAVGAARAGPEPDAAINAAKNAKAATEAAQKKNAEALDPQRRRHRRRAGAPAAPAAAGAASRAATAGPVGEGPATPTTRPDAAIRSSSLLGARRRPAVAGGARPLGRSPGCSIERDHGQGRAEVARRGTSSRWCRRPTTEPTSCTPATRCSTDASSRLPQDAVVFSQDVNDPLSLVKQREVRKSIRPEAR